MPNRIEELESIRVLCEEHSFEKEYSFAILLDAARKVFPILDKEIASVYETTTDIVALWTHASFIPDKITQTDVVNYIKYRVDDEEAVHKLSKGKSLIIASSNNLVEFFPNAVPFYLPWIFKAKQIISGLVSKIHSNDISVQNFQSLIAKAEHEREAVFQLRLNKLIGKCNRKILKAIAKNNPSLLFKIGPKTVESVRLAHSIKNYLTKANIFVVAISYDFIVLDKGNVYLEINL